MSYVLESLLDRFRRLYAEFSPADSVGLAYDLLFFRDMKTSYLPFILLVALAGSVVAQDFRPGRPALPDVTLSKPAKGEAAIQALSDKLPGVARHYGVSAEVLSDRMRKDKDLWVDHKGRLFFAESNLPYPALELEPAVGAGTGQAGLAPVEMTFFLHSLPSATKKIYLDFTGHTTTGTYWKDIKDGDSTFTTPPYDFDGVTSGFSTSELQRIQFIWQRVAEDYAPFNVDVTTEDPGVEGLRKTTTADMNYGIRVCIGGASTDWYSTSGYGGVAYIGCFDWNTDTPCFVFPKNLGNGNEKYVAEAVSHEVGHTLDLYHDGTSTAGYYSGQGTGADSWAPIMGVGYYCPVVQFSKGEYLDANNTEDDLAKITADYNIPYLADDHGNAFSSATPLSSGTLQATGIIERNTDVDMFQFDAGAGTFSIVISVDSRSPNLNVTATLFDGSGAVVAVTNPPATLGASFNLAGMPGGHYYLQVDGDGSGDPLNTGYSGYGSIGIYGVSGTVPQSGYPVAAAAADPVSGSAPLSVQFSSAGSSDPDGGLLAYAWDFGNGLTSDQADPSVVYTQPGTYTATLTVTDDEGFSATAPSLQIVVHDVAPVAPSALAATPVSSTRIDLGWQDNSGNETGFKIERSTNGVTFAQIATVAAGVTAYSDTGVTSGRTYTYRVRAFNAYGDSAYTDPASATTPAPPPTAPSRLTVRAASMTQINLSWKDMSSNETGFYVECSLNGVNWSRVATLAANTTTYASTGLTRNTKYYYRVQSFNASGVSAYSSVASTKTRN